MKAKLWIFSTLLVALFGFSAYNIRALDDKNELIIKLMMQALKTSHYEEMKIDDAFSEKVYKLYIERLDYSKRFLTKVDLAQLDKYKHLVDDEIQKYNYEFFNEAEAIYNRRYQQTQEFYQEILASPFDFTVVDSVALVPEKIEYPNDKDDLKNRWYKVLKYQTMIKLADLIEEQNKALSKKDTVMKERSFVELEEDARKKVLKNTDTWFQRLARMKPETRLAIYLNTVVGAYDPHTGYFPPEDKESFDISMSGKLQGIGATLQEKDGYIRVMELFPGSPSYRQGELKKDDIILKVAQGEGEPVDVVDMPLEDAVKLIRGKKGTTVNLTIKKPDGLIKTISIVRDIVIIEETFAKSVVVTDKNTSKNYGYIFLPRFYADFNDPRGRRCATDIKAEIEKLKTENIEGIILDLRNNGGGSLSDVVDMTGLFVDKGPVVQVKARYAEPRIMADENRLYNGTFYDGKLLVMINSNSASASEILAAAIQDYKRGIIVGSFASFGKGTVQKFANLDDYLIGQGELKPLGSLKLTIQKFYRINGGATQLKGVESDIVFPNSYSMVKNGEREQEYYLPWDEIKPVPYDLWSNPPNYESLRRNSKKRTDANPRFQLINENAKRLKAAQDDIFDPLNLAAYQTEQKRNKEEADKLKKEFEKEIPGFIVKTIKSEESYVKADSVRSKIHEDWKKELKKDTELFESMQILNEMK